MGAAGQEMMAAWARKHNISADKLRKTGRATPRYEQSSLGEIRPDIDALIAGDSVCLRASPSLPQGGDL